MLAKSPKATLYTGGFSGFVASTAAPIATDWSDPCRVGFAPTEDVHLTTAHHEISVGRTNRLDNSDLVLETQGLGEDGYEIAVDRSRVFLLGGTRRGPINAVLALLEEDLGCRWYTPSAHRAEKQTVLEVGIVPRRYLPALSLRDPFVFDAFDGDWSLMNRTNSHAASVAEEFGGHLSYPPSWFVHTAGKMLSLDLFEEHPEYFAEIDGKRMREREGRHPAQLCLTNPNVQALASEKVVRILDENPTARLISVSPNDGGDYCTCSVCTAFNKAEKSDGATLLQFVNLVAEAIAAKHPDVRVVHLAYLGTDTATKTIRPRDNVVVMFATDYDAWRWPFVPYTTTEVTHRRLAPWLELGAHVYVWDYVSNFSHYLLPMPNISVIERNMHFLLEQGVEGLFLQAPIRVQDPPEAPCGRGFRRRSCGTRVAVPTSSSATSPTDISKLPHPQCRSTTSC